MATIAFLVAGVPGFGGRGYPRWLNTWWRKRWAAAAEWKKGAEAPC